MRRSTARRYAEAAFEIAVRDDAVDAWLAAFAAAQERTTDPQVAKILASPAVPVQTRIELLDRLLGDAVQGPPRNLIALLIRRGRFDDLASVIREFRRLDGRRRGVVEATLKAADPLAETDQTAITERLAAITGKRVDAETQVDPSLLGGVQARIGDRLIDGSVRGRLERLRATLTSTAS